MSCGCLAGVCRFIAFEKFLDFNRNILSARLDKLVNAGVLKKKMYKENPPRYEYTVSELGADLRPVIIGLAAWGERHYTKEEAPFTIIHEKCDSKLCLEIKCEGCEEFLDYDMIKTKINPYACARSTELFMQMHPLVRTEK